MPYLLERRNILQQYLSVWVDNGEVFINTRNRDGSCRNIDDMTQVYRQWCLFRKLSSALHEWYRTPTGDISCRKCGTWAVGWSVVPSRGCNNSKSLSVAPRLK